MRNQHTQHLISSHIRLFVGEEGGDNQHMGDKEVDDILVVGVVESEGGDGRKEKGRKRRIGRRR